MRDFTLDESAWTEADDRLDRLLATAHAELVDAIEAKQQPPIPTFTDGPSSVSTPILDWFEPARMADMSHPSANHGPLGEAIKPAVTGIPGFIRQCREELARASAEEEVRWAVNMVFNLGGVIASSLAVRGPVKLRGMALNLVEFCGAGREVLTHGFRAKVPDFHSVGLTDEDDLPQILRDTVGLLGEAGIAVVGLACAADDEATYWILMETIDALDEARDCTGEMLRRLSAHDPARSNRV